MTKDEALKLALDAFEALIDKFSDVSAYEDKEHAFTNELIFIPDIKKAIKAIAAAKETLAQPEHEQALLDAIVGGTGVMLGDKRIDPASIYKQPEQEAWGVDWGKDGDIPCVSIIKRLPDGGIEVLAVEYGPPRPWVGLTDEERASFDAANPKTQEEWDALFDGIEAKLKEKNT